MVLTLELHWRKLAMSSRNAGNGSSAAFTICAQLAESGTSARNEIILAMMIQFT